MERRWQGTSPARGVAFEPQRRQAERYPATKRVHGNGASPNRASSLVDEDGGRVAPMAKSAPWPSEIWPLKPVNGTKTEYRNGIDNHQAQLQVGVVADESGGAAEKRQQEERAEHGPEPAVIRTATGGGVNGGRDVVGGSGRHGLYTRLTVTWPNRPLGFSVNTVMTMTSATISFSPLPIK